MSTVKDSWYLKTSRAVSCIYSSFLLAKSKNYPAYLKTVADSFSSGVSKISEDPRSLEKDFSLFPKCTIIFFTPEAQGTLCLLKRIHSHVLDTPLQVTAFTGLYPLQPLGFNLPLWNLSLPEKKKMCLSNIPYKETNVYTEINTQQSPAQPSCTPLLGNTTFCPAAQELAQKMMCKYSALSYKSWGIFKHMSKIKELAHSRKTLQIDPQWAKTWIWDSLSADFFPNSQVLLKKHSIILHNVLGKLWPFAVLGPLLCSLRFG